MNQELMTLDFWRDTVIYESKTFPVGTLACDALNVPVNTIAKNKRAMRENQSAAWNIKRRTGCFCTLSYCKGSCSDDARYSQSNTAVLLYEYLKAQRTD